MKIFSNFDTKLKKRIIERYQAQFGKNNVVLLVKWPLFCLLKICLPFLAFLLPSAAILLLFNVLVWEDALLYGGIPLVVLGFFIILGPLLRRYIAYRMDFSIVTPKMLITYDQRGVFDRVIRTINTFNIRTVSVEEKWFRYSITNTGDLTFLSEGGDVEHGEIVLHYIYKPERRRYEVAQVLKRM